MIDTHFNGNKYQTFSKKILNIMLLLIKKIHLMILLCDFQKKRKNSFLDNIKW